MLHLHSDAYANRALASTPSTQGQAPTARPAAEDTAAEDVTREEQEDLPNEPPLRKVSKLC